MRFDTIVVSKFYHEILIVNNEKVDLLAKKVKQNSWWLAQNFNLSKYQRNRNTTSEEWTNKYQGSITTKSHQYGKEYPSLPKNTWFYSNKTRSYSHISHSVDWDWGTLCAQITYIKSIWCSCQNVLVNMTAKISNTCCLHQSRKELFPAFANTFQPSSKFSIYIGESSLIRGPFF